MIQQILLKLSLEVYLPVYHHLIKKLNRDVINLIFQFCLYRGQPSSITTTSATVTSAGTEAISVNYSKVMFHDIADVEKLRELFENEITELSF